MTKAKNIHEVTVEVNGDEWNKKVDEAFKKIIKEVKIDGFRPGKAPRDVYEKKHGKQYLLSEAADMAVSDAYTKALKDFNDPIIMQPEVSIEKIDESGVTYKFVLTTKPEVVIKNYKGLDVKAEKVSITAKEVDDEIENIRKEYADFRMENRLKVVRVKIIR
ncbi:MAG: trigger factor family protein [Bacilli bacterium]